MSYKKVLSPKDQRAFEAAAMHLRRNGNDPLPVFLSQGVTTVSTAICGETMDDRQEVRRFLYGIARDQKQTMFIKQLFLRI